MEIREEAIQIAERLSERKAKDITVIDIAGQSSFADFFVNATAGSARQLGALLEDAEESAEKLGLQEKGVEGKPGTGWMLIDLGDIIVNIFTEETREKYALDKIWGDCEKTTIGE